ncbi:uncharacterized protein STEHIDRAFT_90412 [Stereum hirsutum FP-91666 SS1]|uniref:uncharacterized protein n=1 Tax=Stereum hirsutum (strain FP-91666) TaxID=721885 RepID=UPI000440F186|nr:uncharacterized protein STEHIDRAFT_90412 [Stereum hirsutum FP-91666 SS1]EIM90564.1 hypothetical protein STEHIDRAFT_90412 [Stereum hirsutum FP-91666 SS1]
MTQPQVLIIGAGPTASILALTLAQNDIPVRIIEKLEKPSEAQRGIGVQARSLEIYKFLGVLDDVLADARSLPGVKQYDDDGRLVSTKPGRDFMNSKLTPDKPLDVGHAIGQDRLCRIFAKHASKFNINVEYSSELVSLEEQEGHVTATIRKGDRTETVDAAFVVGADGGKSTVRKLLDLEFVGKTGGDDRRMVIGDIQMTGSIDKEHWCFYGSPPGDMLSIIATKRAFEEDVYLFFATGPGIDVERAVADREYLLDLIRKKTRIPDLQFGEIKTLATYRPNNFRVVDTFRKGRVFVAGDAAHVHSATGVQGLNSGVMDSFNLAWKLSLIMKGLSPPSLLDTYTEERLPVIQDMLRLTEGLLKQLHDPNRKGGMMDRPAIMNQLGVNYRSSSIHGGGGCFWELRNRIQNRIPAYESDGVLRAGARAPEAPQLLDLKGTAKTLSLFDIFKPYIHTVLICSSGSGDDSLAVAKYLCGLPTGTIRTVMILPKGSSTQTHSVHTDFILGDTEGHAFRAYGAVEGEGRVVVVRPDGYVGAIVRSVEGVRKYFSMIFNA